MAKYGMTIEIDAEQFLPDEDKIPKGVMSDGRHSPKTDPRSSWIINTPDGASYINPGDYVITLEGGGKYKMSAEDFELRYKLLES